jgi:alcohol dehydrogenase, propanol-preferring
MEVYCADAVVTGLHCDGRLSLSLESTVCIADIFDSIGSYKQYLSSPARYTTIIPDGVSDYVAGPIMCSASTAYTSLKESGLRPGSWAVFLGGGGGAGIQGVQLAAAMGMQPIVVDTGDDRRKLAMSLGAQTFVDFLRVRDPVQEVLNITGGGADGVFVTGKPLKEILQDQLADESPAVQSYPGALSYLGNRVGGIIMCIGLPPTGKFHVDLDPSTLIFRKQSIKGTLVSSLGDIDETLDFARRGTCPDSLSRLPLD